MSWRVAFHLGLSQSAQGTKSTSGIDDWGARKDKIDDWESHSCARIDACAHARVGRHACATACTQMGANKVNISAQGVRTRQHKRLLGGTNQILKLATGLLVRRKISHIVRNGCVHVHTGHDDPSTMLRLAVVLFPLNAAEE